MSNSDLSTAYLRWAGGRGPARRRITRSVWVWVTAIGFILAVHIVLSTADGLNRIDSAWAGAPGAGKQDTLRPGWQRKRRRSERSMPDDVVLVPAGEVWAFCQTQRRTCIRICATFFRGRASCTQSCRNLSQTCVSGGCFHWQRNLWRLAAHHNARYCVR